jgi:pimeloyl-ACP methyl ester carboxylesterase
VSKDPTALYLHGGPGLNCAVERAWFGENYPVFWWDQPRFSADVENAYQTTLDSAAKKLAELHARLGKPVHVIGWSFGARLALDLACRPPESIGPLTLLAPSLCLETAFERMAGYLAAKAAGMPTPLASAPRPDHHTGNHEDFMQRVMNILSTPDVFSHYWAPTSGTLSARHNTEAALTHWFDLDTFTAVSRELIKRPIASLSLGQVNRINILAGRHDPYFDPKADIGLWKTLFPEASIRIVDSGHMLPLEIPIAEWLTSPVTTPDQHHPEP